MDEWLKNLLAGLKGKISNPGGYPGGTPPFIEPNKGYPPLRGDIPGVQAQVPVNNPSAPVMNAPSNQVPGSPPQTTVPNVVTPEAELADKLGQYNQVAQQDPKLKHTVKNNILQGLFLGLQGVQRIADPDRAPQGPIKYLGEARKEDKLNRMAPLIQSLGAQVSARREQQKADLATQNTQSEIKARDTDRQIKQYNQEHPGMEIIKDGDGNILERPKGSTEAFKPAGGTTPVKKIPITLSDGRSVEVPTIDAVRLDTAKAERDTERLFQEGRINQEQVETHRKEMDDWRQKEETRTNQVVTWTNDALSKDQEAKSLREQAKTIPGTKEALDLETKAAAAEVERDRLFNQAKTSTPTPKPSTPTSFSAPSGTVPGKRKVSKASDPYNLLN